LSRNAILSIILIILEGKSKPCWLTGLTAHFFAGVAYKFCGSLQLSMFHGGLRWRLGV